MSEDKKPKQNNIKEALLDYKEKLLQAKKKNIEILPSRVILSSNALSGEQLIPTVKAPVDRETSAPLAEIIFPKAKPITLPILW